MWVFAIIIALLVAGWAILKTLDLIASKDPQNFSELPKITVKGPAGNLRVALANTEDSLGKGISGQEKLRDVHGVLLIPPKKSTSITMLGVKFPLDIVWLDDDNHVVHILHSVNPGIWPLMIRSPQPARKVLEVPAGKLKKLGTVSVGDQLTLS